MRLRPRTLYGKTLATIAVVSAGFLLFMSIVIAKFLLIPIRDRSTVDVATLMLQSAEQWHAQPVTARRKYAITVQETLGFQLRDVRRDLPERGIILPYFYFLEEALSQRLRVPLKLRIERGPAAETWYWVAVPGSAGTVDVGLPQSYIAVQPPLAIFLVLSVGVLVTVITAVVLVHRLTAPLKRLASATHRLGSGEWPEPVPETGPEEMSRLAGSFNRMVVQVQELLANRTTLLAGISHDLRTPLARLQIAVEMLPKGSDPTLIQAIRVDLLHMNSLIGQFLGVARGLEDPQRTRLELRRLLRQLVESSRRAGTEIVLREGPPCATVASEVALRRVLGNLLDNEVRYGNGRPVEVEWHCAGERVALHVLDRGPGIPAHAAEAVFQPFFRLETSRNRETGGSGLGLAIARQLAIANGWEIKLLSRHGGGTRAILKLGTAEAI